MVLQIVTLVTVLVALALAVFAFILVRRTKRQSSENVKKILATLEKAKDHERKQTPERKGRDTRNNLANRFANLVTKSELGDHYEVSRATHHMGVIEYVNVSSRKTKSHVVTVEVSFNRQPDYHIMIVLPDSSGWHFGSDTKSLQEAMSHFTTGLYNQAH